MNARHALASLALAVALAAAPARANDVAMSKHNFSTNGPGSIKSTGESQVCIFCHVSHKGRDLGLNRPDPGAFYTPYASSTMQSLPGFPTAATRVCLSCHDGTVAVGMTVASGTLTIANTDAAGAIPAGPSRLGTDLRATHPVSVVPRASTSVRAPPPFDPVKLDGTGQLQCTTCHDPHREDADPAQRKFLVKSNRYGEMCTTCHTPAFWSSGSTGHQTSGATVPPVAVPGLTYATMTEDACALCHVPHHADPSGRLVRTVGDGTLQNTCLACHDGTMTQARNVADDLAKPSSHRERSGARVHDAGEGPASRSAPLPETDAAAPRHATCPDCHDAHAATSQPAPASGIAGWNRGAWGIDRNGQRVSPAQFQYELCFKCHGDSRNQPGANGAIPPSWPRRASPDVNLRFVFDVNAISFHPVVGRGKGSDVPSLLAPLSAASVILCTDCHASDQRPRGGPTGPHGSSYPFLLERDYQTLDGTAESAAAYALCYKCHDRGVLLSSGSAFPLHDRHVVVSRTPCSACHNGHGISQLHGTPAGSAHLVDFDEAIVGPGPGGLHPQYASAGYRAGSCSTSCHGVVHGAASYGTTTAAAAALKRRAGLQLAHPARPAPRR